MNSSHSRISDVETALAVIANEKILCNYADEADPSEQPEKLHSCAGGTFWGRRGESWPVNAMNEPLMPWLQVVGSELPLASSIFRDRLTCFFLDSSGGDYAYRSRADRHAFVVRTYALDDPLVPLARPFAYYQHPYCKLSWSVRADYPSLSKYSDLFAREVYDALCDENALSYQRLSGVKIGGWPTTIQREQPFPNAHDLQIDMLHNYTYADSGIAFVDLDPSGWHVLFESC